MAAEGGNIIWFTYTGADDEVIDDEATHIFVQARVVRARAFRNHPNIVEVICDDIVEKIEEHAFYWCLSLRRVIMPNVIIVEAYAFDVCLSLETVECGKLEIIGGGAFCCCYSLRSMNLSSVRIVDKDAFKCCHALRNVNFGSKLERMEEIAFYNCESLERITIPLKDGLIAADNIFWRCDNLHQVHLVEGVHETVATFHLEEWRNDMNKEIDSINQTLPDTPSGGPGGPGEKTQAMRRWIRSVLRKIIRYQEGHRRLLEEAATTLEPVLPNNDIVRNNVLPFLKLPSHTFEMGGDDEATRRPNV